MGVDLQLVPVLAALCIAPPALFPHNKANRGHRAGGGGELQRSLQNKCDRWRGLSTSLSSITSPLHSADFPCCFAADQSSQLCIGTQMHPDIWLASQLCTWIGHPLNIVIDLCKLASLGSYSVPPFDHLIPPTLNIIILLISLFVSLQSFGIQLSALLRLPVSPSIHTCRLSSITCSQLSHLHPSL